MCCRLGVLIFLSTLPPPPPLLLSLSLCSLSLFLFQPPSLLFLSLHQLWVVDSTKPELWKMSHILVILPYLSQHTAKHTLLTEQTELSPPYLSSFLLMSHLSSSSLAFRSPTTASSHSVSPSGLHRLSHFSSSACAGDKIRSDSSRMEVRGWYWLNTVCIDTSHHICISLRGCSHSREDQRIQIYFLFIIIRDADSLTI